MAFVTFDGPLLPAPPIQKREHERLGAEIGRLVDQKNVAYGDAFGKAGEFLKLLWPEGIEPCQYGELLTIVRIFDKLMRVASDRGAFGEDPYRDIAGYALLAVKRGVSATS